MPYLTDKHQRELFKSWVKYGITAEQGMKLRKKAQTDLFFLCKLLGWTKMTEATHREVTDFFVSKDPFAYPDLDLFCAAYDGPHDRTLLVPRGGYKSTIDVADCVQWIICYPDITILILTAASGLAIEFITELKSHFHLTVEGNPKPMKDGKPSLFQILFPEHCYAGKGGNQDEYFSPMRSRDSLRTCWAAGIDQNLSGFHFYIIKADDVITNACKTAANFQTITKSYDTNLYMLNPGGFSDKIGTRYDDNDLYGRDVKREEKAAAEGETALTKILLRAALTLKPEFSADAIEDVLRKNEPDKVDLWFPEVLTFAELRSKLKKGSWEVFCCQYLNQPSLFKERKFNRSAMMAATLPYTQLPRDGIICVAFDTACSTQHWADYTVGLAAIYSAGRCYVLDMMRGRYNEYELPAAMAAFCNKWRPRRVGVEDSVGVKWLLREVRRELQRYNLPITLEPINVGLGGKGLMHSKTNKAQPVIRLLGDGRLLFSSTISHIEDLYDELEAFPNAQHDDIVSALTYLGTYFMSTADLPQPGYSTAKPGQNFSDHIFGSQRPQPQAPPTSYGLPPILGELSELE